MLQAQNGHTAGSEVLVIQTQGLSKTYPGVSALKSLDLCIPEHTICAFLGPNGAGKSTAIKLLLGLARPTSGTGVIFGYDIVRDSLAIRRRVGYLAQEPRFYDHMTARDTLRFVARFFYAGPTAAIEARVVEALELVGLSAKADRLLSGFSGGERQRLGIAQAQINHPGLLILDEPAASLDPLGRRDVLEVMQRLRSTTTIFYSTHLLDDVQRVSDMVVIVKEGEVLVQAPLNTLLTEQNVVTYELTLQGNTQHVHTAVAQQPWVSKIELLSARDPSTWRITVSDERAAETSLLSLITENGLARVLAFGRKQDALEDVFITLMEGKHNVR
ncbi:MAG: ABC transporter ATP-binding protein [Herpetosiphonaceae bacterium]|nr:ABC transporter ATP-binding protein [Herpetosiphonaceae bacterium]